MTNDPFLIDKIPKLNYKPRKKRQNQIIAGSTDNQNQH